ncbi:MULTISPECIES: ABC-2 transporter permease [Bacillus]|uniref:ABC transporter permease protein n=1 Tax=Bacillus cereus (strain ATCC 14579 / DSM 31 / CCUG 7414 / JCM 2152 / NBRC 15305 / NCIMB 9373 / NCTC 2599 / NRRL B-3711) TaxID=226900 RepID=Q818N2_BACCR|nr:MULTISPECIES: ABC-2 transporter permease [Bacillus]MDV8107813.1 ABC-2 transporter permease [Bacillus sp. BAU-SS-2023]CGF78238.1 ABC-2 family transporter protein [Streptococcus pneumoniae]AAP11132.1 ABC transporter permease protein [Bacillus cereus ATCC 14579]AQQ64879.1 ABC-2 membrane transporter-like protein [Bacillus cereus]KZD72433.1 ABC transporter permease protein [Bacillus cereus]
MKQLILKDFIIQWKFLIWYILYPVFFYMALTDTENLFIIMSVIITIGATVKTFEADSKNESEVIVNSLPILRKQIVYAKYIVAIIILFISVTVGCFTMGMKSGVNLFEFLETTMVASISFILLYLSFVLPISFWLGYKKTIFITIVIFMAPIVVLEALFQINLEQIQLYNSLLFISSMCMFIASTFVSVKIYEKREF